ncbi:hypothetical protein [Eubacterium oxidoreducens]|uniref:Uncharacterized protein n=1 Tax=Eubacterium oxidoreducens TaxID=1732 RepID=A0A1G6C0F4_EUBOX|nr:hypothetical protein [Eubacterium oxidoreducens]SDB26317.1 hypothetical protein SAMN02910417_01935 [Eubacterium oxidoreducens]
MSQAKVDRYKQEKANRKQIMAKQKRQSFFGKLIFLLILAAIVVWAVFSIKSYIESNTEVTKTYVNLDALTDYLYGTDTEE